MHYLGVTRPDWPLHVVVIPKARQWATGHALFLDYLAGLDLLVGFERRALEGRLPEGGAPRDPAQL